MLLFAIQYRAKISVPSVYITINSRIYSTKQMFYIGRPLKLIYSISFSLSFRALRRPALPLAPKRRNLTPTCLTIYSLTRGLLQMKVIIMSFILTAPLAILTSCSYSRVARCGLRDSALLSSFFSIGDSNLSYLSNLG